MRVFPLAESSFDPPHAVKAREQTLSAMRVRLNPVLLMDGPLWTGAGKPMAAGGVHTAMSAPSLKHR
ncbi:hypothetical protein TPA0910_04560 [Streptomyces hygroscopicus subsp. sporocinereus]|uniref:Uncharacterized protein n=1 Tax=Streptomyces hygroscopicus TaxID=1912 RepID=A0ABQ3TRZ4_STRHY|nr:hypothetical protein TPA0910_04560 [Streptomyces hygroscopicus]GLV72671.1 hypothetical protein Shyhy02_06740 [Streptomyces hygroscopicus subsp. hygroscopicus]